MPIGTCAEGRSRATRRCLDSLGWRSPKDSSSSDNREVGMVAAKGERKSAEEAWAVVAAANGYRCAMCGTVPPHAERAMFFARDLCGWCADAMDKDDRAAARST
jgi:hypothetical protein